jgi:hypothetical protein
MPANAESDNTVYNIGLEEIFSCCFSAAFDADVASAALMLSSLFLSTVVLLVFRSSTVFSRFETSLSCVRYL